MSLLTNKFLLLLLVVFCGYLPNLSAQVTAKKLLPRNINVNYLNQLAPSVSGDGNHLIFLSDQVSSKRLNMMYSRRTGLETWSDPEVIKEIDNSFEINHLRGYSISFDGKQVFFTSLKSGGIGGYDIWRLTRRGNSWSQPENLGKPLNSAGNEADASLAPDGKTLYFMRCEKVNMNSTENCTLYYATKKNSILWNEPIALPANINEGNAVSPRMLSDNETLYFSSNKPGGKGGYDLYLSRKEESGWSDPVGLSFINSEVDDRYVGLTAKGDVLFYSMKYKEKDKLVMAKIPAPFQPLKIFQINGKITALNASSPLEAIVQVFDTQTQKLVSAVKAPQNTGEFYLLLKGGATYDISVNPIKKDFLFHSEIIDLQELEVSAFERKELQLIKIEKGLTFEASNISFEPFTANITPTSLMEIRRLSRMLRDNPNINLEIGAHLGQYLSDSVQSSQDLTEVIADTVSNPAYNYYQQDSIKATLLRDSLQLQMPSDPQSISVTADSSANGPNFMIADRLAKLNDFLENTPVPEKEIISYTYHNDRTEKEAEAVYEQLIKLGVPEGRISYKGYGATAKNENTAIEEDTLQSNRIEIKVY